MKIRAMVSGGFDPLHVGHVELLKAAKGLCDELIVALNGDKWLMKKKGFVFMPWDHRRAILESIKYVDEVVRVTDLDDTVCDTLRIFRPHFFINSGDRVSGNVPEEKLCAELGIRSIWIGTKYQDVHSSKLISDATMAGEKESAEVSERPSPDDKSWASP